MTRFWLLASPTSNDDTSFGTKVVDEDDDLDVPRAAHVELTIHHNYSTALDLVGLQVGEFDAVFSRTTENIREHSRSGEERFFCLISF